VVAHWRQVAQVDLDAARDGQQDPAFARFERPVRAIDDGFLVASGTFSSRATAGWQARTISRNER
jgi:hypothetical protein